MLALALAVMQAACGQGQASKASQPAPASHAAATAAPDTGATDTTRADTAGNGVTSGRGMMGGRTGMMGGRMGMMGGSGGQAPAASAQATADTGACPQITQALADEGGQIFTGAGHCAACHGASGQGGPLAPDLADTTWLDTNGSYVGIASIVQSGVPQPKQHPTPMPPMGGASLSAQQVCAVAGYVYSLSHKQ